jgi:hypothetical protein
MLPPIPDRYWNRYAAAHLLNRAAFGGTPRDIDRLFLGGNNQAVQSLLKAPEDPELFPPPPELLPGARHELYRKVQDAPDEEARKEAKKALNTANRQGILDLRIWWLNRMRYTSNPLLEKATLFWHGHFATSNQKVQDPYLMWVQNETLRAHALGSFPDLLKAMSRDPAMIKWLDLNQSRKDHPNENFAREVMELFSLGEGHYSESDVQEAARAFTGYRIKPEDSSFHFAKGQSDSGQKTFLGRTGPFTGDDIIDIIVAQPECARFLGRKLWAFFVSENPPEVMVGEVADLLMKNGYHIGATLGAIFRSAAFYSGKVMHHEIKGPVQWLIQTTKMLEIPLPEQKVLENAMAALGQVIFAPPNVKGWDGGRSWISSSSLLYRYNFASYLLSGKARVLGGGGSKTAQIPLDRIAPPETREDSKKLLDRLVFRVFNSPILGKEMKNYEEYLAKHGTPASDSTIRDLMQIMMSTPAFQLV